MTSSKKTLTITNIPRGDVPGDILFECIIGISYSGSIIGTDPTDEPPVRGVYIADQDDVYSSTQKDVLDLGNNIRYYELGTFVKKLAACEVEAIEMMFIPMGYIIYCNNYFLHMILNRKVSYLGRKYGIKAIAKATDLLQSFHIPVEKAEDLNRRFRTKSMLNKLDYITVLDARGFYKHASPFRKYISNSSTQMEKNVEKYASVAIPGFKNTRHLYYDVGKTYSKGIFNSKGEFMDYNITSFNDPVGIIHFNEEAYQKDLVAISGSNEDCEIDISQNCWHVKNNIAYNSHTLTYILSLLDTATQYFTSNHVNLVRKRELEYYCDVYKGNQDIDELLISAMIKLEVLIDKVNLSDEKEGMAARYADKMISMIRKYWYSNNNNDRDRNRIGRTVPINEIELDKKRKEREQTMNALEQWKND